MVNVHMVIEHGKRWFKWTLVAEWLDGSRHIIGERMTWRKANKVRNKFLATMNA